LNLGYIVLLMCILSVIFEICGMLLGKQAYDRLVHFIIAIGWGVSIYHVIKTL